MSDKISEVPQKPQVTGQKLPIIVKQGSAPQHVQLPSATKQLITPKNMPGKSTNFGQSNPSGQMNNAIRAMAADTTALRKENTELKAKLTDAATKTPLKTNTPVFNQAPRAIPPPQTLTEERVKELILETLIGFDLIPKAQKRKAITIG